MILRGLLCCCLFQLKNSLLNPPPSQAFLHVQGSPSTDPAGQNAPPLGHCLCLLIAFPGPSFTKPPHPDSEFTLHLQPVSFTVCNSAVTSQRDQISPFNGQLLVPMLPRMAYRWTDYPHPCCLSGPASYPPSPSSSWPLHHLASAAPLNSPIIATKIGSFFRHLLSILTTSYSELLFTAILVTQLISMCLLTAPGALLEGRLCSAHHRVSAPRTVPGT